ncbi:MAG: DMT family transporter [Thermomicrobiales bacterium]
MTPTFEDILDGPEPAGQDLDELRAPAAEPAGADAGSGGLGAPEAALLLVVLLWSSTFIISKAIFAEMLPLPYIAVRFLIMSALAVSVMLLRRRGSERMIRREDLPRFLAVAFTGYTLYQLFFVLGLERTSPFSSSLLVAMVPIIGVVMTSLMGEKHPRQAWIGLAVAVLGAAVFLWEKRGDSGSGSLAGDLLSIGAAFAFAAYGMLARPLVASYPTETFTAWTIVLGSIPLVLVAIPSSMRENWPGISGMAWLAVVYMAIFPVYIAYQIWNWGIARRGLAAATSFSLLVPIASGILSAIFFGERFGPAKLAGAALVLAGLVIVRVPSLRFRARGGERSTT